MTDGKKIGLALSGGGYRAAAFHLGVLKKLQELNIIERLDVISTISGGSIIGAHYLLNKDNFDFFYEKMYHGLQISVIKKIVLSPTFILITASILTLLSISLIFIPKGWGAFAALLLVIIVLILFHNIFPISKLAAKAYDQIFFNKVSLRDFPDKPAIVINASNIETGTLWTFSKNRMGDSSYFSPYRDSGIPKIDFKHKDFPISTAVASSTAVPYLFSPITIKKKYFINPADKKQIRPKLVDGGVYDNQGIHKISHESSSYKCDIIICSDASQPFRKQFMSINPLPILKRVMDVLMRRIKNLQFMDNIYHKEARGIKEIAYFSLDWEYQKSIDGFLRAFKQGKISDEIKKAHKLEKYDQSSLTQPIISEIEKHLKVQIGFSSITANAPGKEKIAYLSKTSTHLKALTKKQIDLLIKHAEALTELQIKLYCPSLME